MSSSSSYPTDRDEVVKRQKRGPPFKFLVPLVYAPALPLIRLTLRHQPVLRDRLFTAVLIGAFAHGSYLVDSFLLYSASSNSNPSFSALLAAAVQEIPLGADLYDSESK